MDSEQWQRWISQAHDDFAYGEAGVEDFPRGAAWNFHQAAEKSFKALLLLKSVEFLVESLGDLSLVETKNQEPRTKNQEQTTHTMPIHAGL